MQTGCAFTLVGADTVLAQELVLKVDKPGRGRKDSPNGNFGNGPSIGRWVLDINLAGGLYYRSAFCLLKTAIINGFMRRHQAGGKVGPDSARDIFRARLERKSENVF